MKAQVNIGPGGRVLVIGLGRSGRATLDVLGQRGVRLSATDESRQVLTMVQAEFQTRNIRVLAPGDIAGAASDFDAAVLSPGIPLTSPIVASLRDAGIPVVSEIEAAYLIARAPIIAITGTKGKSTTTALTGALLKAAGRTTYVGGNIGNALIAETAVAEPEAWVVAELSSFQLETIATFRPRVATLLNLSPDHLDRYGSMAEYAAAKYRIFAHQTETDYGIGNLDDPVVVAALQKPADRPRCQMRWFAYDPHPQASLFVHNERICWRSSLDQAATVELMPLAEIQLLGRHNVENVLAGLLMGLLVGCDPADLRNGVKNFRALSHRLEPIADIGGVRYINDSKGTNPGAVIAALAACRAPVIVIAGGKKKGTDFYDMGLAIAKYARATVLLGEAADDIAATITGIPVVHADSMDAAVGQAVRLAQPGDVVLLSPGCASFDMFRSAEERGEAFAAAVRSRDRILQ